MRIPELYSIYLQHSHVQTDTRKLNKGDLYFALKGPNFNGNSFAMPALEAGAAYAIVDEYTDDHDSRIIPVHDVLETLQELALYHRSQFSIPVIAITGSNGKTTTKELVHEVLRTRYITYTTEGNLNNHIGVPLTILKIKHDAEVAIIEMGANHLGEIAGYCRYAMPTHGLITNCGKAHLEGFGGAEGIRKGKGELFDHLRAHGGTAFVMWDYNYLREMSAGISNLVRYGTHDEEYAGTVSKKDPFLEVQLKNNAGNGLLKTQLVGEYNLPNVLAAVAIGKHFEIPDEQIKSAIEGYCPSNSRSQLILNGTNRIILDAYNANPSSMKAAIENFAGMDGENKILMLGGMMELGTESLAEHQAIIRLIAEHPWKQVVLVGGDFGSFKNNHLYFSNSAEAAAWYKEQDFQQTLILIKGSRSMQMEKVLTLY